MQWWIAVILTADSPETSPSSVRKIFLCPTKQLHQNSLFYVYILVYTWCWNISNTYILTGKGNESVKNLEWEWVCKINCITFQANLTLHVWILISIWDAENILENLMINVYIQTFIYNHFILMLQKQIFQLQSFTQRLNWPSYIHLHHSIINHN
jgi:hypothetical protein